MVHLGPLHIVIGHYGIHGNWKIPYPHRPGVQLHIQRRPTGDPHQDIRIDRGRQRCSVPGAVLALRDDCMDHLLQHP